MDGLRNQFPMGNTITAQLIRHDLSGLATMVSQSPFEEAFSCCAIPLGLKENIYDFTVLINRSPEVMLLAVDFYEHLVNEEGIAITTVLSLQSSSVYSSELDAPKTDRFAAHGDTPLSE